MIKITDINITFDKQRIIESSSIEIERGKLTAIIGKSGSGKTSILYLVGLLTSYDKSSNYIFDNNQINLNSDSDTSAIRNTKIGYIFQENNILNYLTVYENFELILTMCKKEVSHELVESLLKLVKLDIPIDRLPRQLSGGQRQRLCIALALAKDPDLLILDEPTSNLDTDNTNNVMSVLKDIAVNLNKMILISTHVEEVEQFCDMTYNIVDKKVVLKKNLGTTTKLTKNYKDSLTGGFRFNLYALIIKRYLNHYKKLYLMIIVISLLGVNAIVGTNVVGKIFIDNKADSILEKMDNEMFIASNGDDIYPKFNEMLPSISESKVQEIFEIEEFIEIYHYSEIVLNSIKINDEIIEGHIIIQPIYTNDNDIYIDRHIFETYNCSTISFEIDAVEYELNVNKSLSLYEQNKYGFGVGIFIKVPYDIFYSMTEFSNKAFVARYDDYKSVDVIKEKLQSIDIDIKISYDYLNYNSIINIVEKYEQTMQFFNIIMSVIYISYLLVVYRKLLDQRKDSFSILKTNGLSNKEMLYYLIIEMMFIVGVIVFNSFIIVVVLNTIFGNISIISYLGKTTLYLLVTLLVSILSCSGKLIFKDSVYLLKH